MEFVHLAPNGPIILIPKILGDARGYFMETFRQNEFEDNCGEYHFVQDNQSKSGKNVLRGLHYQLNSPQGKLVHVVSGRVFDVAVDLRKSSPTFGQSFHAILDNVAHHCLWVPPGFAHGFLVLGEEAVFTYKCTAYYAPGDEHTLLWNDPSLKIEWPIKDIVPSLSEKDLRGLPLSACPVYD